jgi:outer membrane protein TolC
MAKSPLRYSRAEPSAWLLARPLLLLLLPLSVFAQTLELSLDEALELARRRNPLIAEMDKRVEEAMAYERETRASFLPSIEFLFSRTIEEKTAEFLLPPLTPGMRPSTLPFDLSKDYQYSVRLRQHLFTGGKLRSAYEQATLRTLLARELKRDTTDQIIYETKRAFFYAILAKDLLKVREESLLFAEKNLERTKRLLEVGMATKLDLMRCEVHLENARAQLIHARNGLECALLALKHAIGLEEWEAIDPKGELAPLPFDFGLEALKGFCLQKRPDLARSRIEKTMADKNVRLAKALYFPQIGLTAEWNIGSDRLTLRRKDTEETHSLAIVLTIPLFDGFARNARLSQEKIARERLNYTSKALEERAILELREAVLDLSAQRESLEARRKAIAQAQEGLRIAELNYEEGLVTSLDVLSAQTTLTEAKTLYLETLYNYNVALARIERACGTNLEELKGD